MNNKIIFLIFLIIFCLTACNTTEPPPESTMTLKLEDVSCIEAWINLTTTNLPLPTTIILKQINQSGVTTSQIINLNTQDSLLYVDSLLPNQTYKFNATIQTYSYTSNELSVTTMDTTSHNFTFETFTFGEHSSSVLYDVVIINENNIWAVGEIYLNDSLGQPDPKRYNAVIWNGNDWTVIRIPYNYQGTDFYHPIQSVFAFGPNNIWFCGNGVIHWDGNSFIPIPIPTNVWGPYQMNKLWGSSSSDLYVVGNEGNIAWYNGQSWQRIESGTGLNIGDIWGISDGGSDSFILCAASNAIAPGEHKILRIINSVNVDTISWISDKRVHSIWMDSKYQLFACGDGVFVNNNSIDWKEQYELTFVFTERVRGNSKNNLFVVGDFGFLAHYNGASWKEYPEASAALVYTSLDIKSNLMVTVGYTESRAVIQKFIGN